MKKILQLKTGVLALIFLSAVNSYSQPPDFEWRVNTPVYNNTDPDGGGLATGSVSFTLQIRTRNSGAIIPITALSTGFCWQNANAMLPTGVPCANSIPQPSNIVMGPAFVGYTYNNVNHCSGTVNFTVGSQTFDRRAVGTVDGGADVVITNAWTDVFTATLWAKNASVPEAGYLVLNSTFGGAPGPFPNYDISDISANVFDANSLTYSTPLALSSSVATPVLFSRYDVKCNDKGALLTWSTASEQNTAKFEIQRSENGTDWAVVDYVAAAGNSATARDYQYVDLNSGVAYYRVRQVDRDGHFVYTEIRRTECKGGAFNVSLFPIPAKDKLTVVVKSTESVRTDLQVMDMNGRIVRKVSTQINKGNNNIVLDVNDLPNGQYMLISSDAATLINKKFTITR